LSHAAASTSEWDAADYARVGGFVAELGEAALELLDPQPGEHILDVGCGDGTLTEKIVERGASVVGIDNSLSMVGAARARGLDARLMDAAQLKFGEAFDAAFSNATMHWVLDKERAARAIWFSLKHGGRFAGEMGGDGNLAQLREALDDVLVARGYGPPTYAANWYPSPEEFAAVYEQAGFKDIDARLIERPTELEHGIAAWVTTFRKGWLDRAGVPEEERLEKVREVRDQIETKILRWLEHPEEEIQRLKEEQERERQERLTAA
jgi:SAM-dependent methyltransferase